MTATKTRPPSSASAARKKAASGSSQSSAAAASTTSRPTAGRKSPTKAAAASSSSGAKKAFVPRHFAIVGAGIAGIACARTLVQAGHRVTVFEKGAQVGGRMASVETAYGSFDVGAQYFTVRDARFELALKSSPGASKTWSANAVRVLDSAGRVAAAAPPTHESHWVGTPHMQALVAQWAQPLTQNSGSAAQTSALHLSRTVTLIERDSLNRSSWQLQTQGPDGEQQVLAGFDAVLLAQPAPIAQKLLADSGLASNLDSGLSKVTMAPCWSLQLAFPQAGRSALTTLGPQWNAARSTHHRVAWLARESSKPQRGNIERWTIHASPEWSQEHLRDDHARIEGKLIKAFAEITGIRAQPSYVNSRCWQYAQTQKAAETSHLWDEQAALGACGDWCLGHRVEDAFLSGLSLALAVA